MSRDKETERAEMDLATADARLAAALNMKNVMGLNDEQAAVARLLAIYEREASEARIRLRKVTSVEVDPVVKGREQCGACGDLNTATLLMTIGAPGSNGIVRKPLCLDCAALAARRLSVAVDAAKRAKQSGATAPLEPAR